MLTQNEKNILGAMVDMGFLRGQDRVNAGSSDEVARELIANFKTQMASTLPFQIINLQQQAQRVAIDLEQTLNLQTLLLE